MVAARIGAVDAVRFSFDVFQQDTTGTDVRLYTDTAVVAKGIPATGFLAVMSVEIRLAEVDTSGVGYSVQVVTASRPAGTAARQITSEYGLPLRMTGLSGKNGARYSLAVKPLKRQTIADGSCSVTSAGLEQYKFDPTAHTDIYFLPNTFGDYYWNLYKSLFETEYDQYDQLIKFNVPGKYMVYLCPCPVASVIWDDRFGQVIDPTRGTAYVVLASGSNTADPFAVLALAVHRQFGYAPAFLVDGFVNIGSVAIDRVKGMQAAGTSISVAPLLNSWDYFTAKNPQAADAVSTAFVKFLVDQYSLDTFLQLYARADDLNLEHAIAQTYGKPVSVLQTEFEKWVAAEAITLSQYEYSAGRAEALFDYASQKKYALKMKPLMVSKYDSVRTFSMLARASFNSGDFYGATDAQRAYLVIDSTTPGWVALGGYQMMNGLYDSAQADLLSALKRDSTEMLVLMNLGLCDLFRGDTSEAGEKLFEVARAGRSGAAEARVLLGHLWLASREQAERARAVPIFQEAINAFQTRTRQHDVSPNEQMWLGMAFLGIEDQSNALSALQLADYLETRPFYRGMISLWLGKAADLRGERDVAVKYYNSVLSGASAHYTQVEARRYLNSPYSQ
jgi:tetratricopeptide (TPR) repeat protein